MKKGSTGPEAGSRMEWAAGRAHHSHPDWAWFSHNQQQGGHGTGKTGKTGNLTLTFSRQGKHREFCCDTGKIFETQGKYFDCILLCECYIFMYFWQSWFQKMGVCR